MSKDTAGYRDSKHVIPGFNLAIIDVDGQVSMDTAKWLLEEYKYLMYTTKRHTDTNNRFRVIFPLSHKLDLNKEDYKEFMESFYDWLPFEVDRQTSDYARKWMTHAGMNYYHEGKLVDATLFIPKTKKSEEQRLVVNGQMNLSNVERWFVNHTQDGSRNNHLIRYGLMLVDSGLPEEDIQGRIMKFNANLANKLDDLEIHTTIFKTISKKIHERGK